MSADVIICPHCRREIPLTEALSRQITEKLQAKFEEQARKQEAELARRREELAQKEQKLKAVAESLENRIRTRLKEERAKLKEQAEKQAREEAELEMAELRQELEKKNQSLKEARELELQLRKERRELQEAREKLDLEIQRRLDEERKQIRESVWAQVQEEYQLKEAEKDNYINTLKNQIEDLRRRAEQGSQQAQGEALEVELEDALKMAFIHDEIEDVPKGTRGADVLQRVRTPVGYHCGTIVWESKRTKNWLNDWIPKLKDDQRNLGAEVAVLVTTAMPKDVQHFALVDGVWVTEFRYAMSLAAALRMHLIELARARQASIGKNEKMEYLYDYLSGPQFRQRVEAIAEAFTAMKADLEKEKRAVQKLWAQREKQLDRIVLNTAGMYGDIQGIIGASLPQIESLELEALPAAAEESGEEPLF